MRGRRIGILVFFLLLVTGGIAWRVLQQPGRQTIYLPDGSQLKLLKVTYGTNHVCRYDSSWREIVYPILPRKFQKKLSAAVIQFSSPNDKLIVWFRHDGAQPIGGWRGWPFFVAAADQDGLEARLLQGANISRILNSKNAPALVGGSNGLFQASQVTGWPLETFPRRTKKFDIRIYFHERGGVVPLVGKFTVQNPAQAEFPGWLAESLPLIRQANELKITLTKLETGLTGKETGQGPAGEGSKSFSRATFKLKENGAPTENWSLCGISSSNAAGEFRPGGSYSSRWQRGEHKVDFEGGLWLEEPAWKINVDFSRTGDFPSDELWSIKGVGVPQTGSLMETRIVTNIHNAELEFLGISGANANLPEAYAGIEPHANLHLRTPHPMEGLRLVLVEARDEHGRKLKTNGSTARTSMGGRGNTPREMLHGFAIEIPEDAKFLDLMFAATRVVHAEFFAKPVLFDSNTESRN